VSAFNVGSSDDPPGKEGLAHFIEHLAFRTKFDDGASIWDRLHRLGANPNAFTQWDFTVYHATAPKDVLEDMMQMEAWRLAHLLEGVTPEIFATEKEVVRNENRQRGETNVGSKPVDMLAAALYPAGHPNARPIGGTHPSLDAITLDDARAFVKKHYRPENCSMVIAGDVSPAFVKKLLGTWPASVLFGPGGPSGPPVPRPPLIASRSLPPVPEPVTRELLHDKGPISQPRLMLAWSVPGGWRRHDAVLDFAARRLNLAFQEGINYRDEDDLEGVSAGAERLINGSIVIVSANLKPGANPEKARARILDALVKAWTTELGTAMTEFLRWGEATSMMLGTSDLENNAVGLAQHLATTGRSSFFKDEFEDLAKVETGEVTALAYKYLTRERAASIYIEPESEQAAKVAGGDEGGSAQMGHELGRDSSSGGEDLGASHILRVARSPGLAALPRWKLANGLQLVAARHGTAPVANIVVGLFGGDAHTNPFGLASYASAFSRQTCSEYGDLEAVGGEIGRSMGSTSSNYTVNVLSGNLSNGMAVLSDALSCVGVNEEAFLLHDQMLDRRKKSYDRVAKMPDFIANKRLVGELYPNHPYGKFGVDPSTLKPVTVEDIAGFMRAHYRPGNAVAVVVGDVDPQQTKELAEKFMAKWSGGAAGNPSLATPPAPAARKAFLIDRPQGTQANVRVACRLADATAETLPLYDIAEAMADKRAWSVREEWGASYGVNASVQTFPGGASHMVIGGAITNKFVGQSVGRLLGILADLDSKKIEEKFFLSQRWEVARKFQQHFSTGYLIAGAILDAAEHGWPDDVWDNYPKRLAAASRQDVRGVMKNCVGHEIITVTGNAAEIRPQLKAIGLKVEAN
jgi:zinc protease